MRVMEGSYPGANIEIHKIALTGITNLEIKTKLRAIYAYSWAWAEAPDNPTYQVYSVSISGGTLTIVCTHATTKDVYVIVHGRA